MTVGELKSVIEKLPDDAPVLIPGSDHSYHLVGHADTEATRSGRGRHSYDYYEYYSEEDLEPGETKVSALILR